jgi:hypothetical protein
MLWRKCHAMLHSLRFQTSHKEIKPYAFDIDWEKDHGDCRPGSGLSAQPLLRSTLASPRPLLAGRNASGCSAGSVSGIGLCRSHRALTRELVPWMAFVQPKRETHSYSARKARGFYMYLPNSLDLSPDPGNSLKGKEKKHVTRKNTRGYDPHRL